MKVKRQSITTLILDNNEAISLLVTLRAWKGATDINPSTDQRIFIDLLIVELEISSEA